MTDQQPARRAAGTFGASIALGVTMGLAGAAAMFASPPAHAFFPVCANCHTWVTQIVEFAAKIPKYAQEASNWRTELKGVTDQLAAIDNMLVNLGIQSAPQMDEVPLNYQVAARCGGFSLSSLSRVFSIDKKGDIHQQQKVVCANMQMMRNVQYNETVRFLRDSHEGMQTDFSNLQRQFGSADNLGNNTKASQDAKAAMYAQKARFKSWQAKMKAYGSYITTMQENQKLLAQTALQGSKSSPEKQFLGQVGKTMILQEALRN